jgi:hypothetical protein
MKPIAAPIVGGMITSTIHALILVPVFFVLMKERALAAPYSGGGASTTVRIEVFPRQPAVTTFNNARRFRREDETKRLLHALNCAFGRGCTASRATDKTPTANESRGGRSSSMLNESAMRPLYAARKMNLKKVRRKNRDCRRPLYGIKKRL